MSNETSCNAIHQHNVGTTPYLASTLLAVIIWSTSFVATKTANISIPPITLGAARAVIATAVLGLLLIFQRQRVKLLWRDFFILSISGLLGITVYFTMENVGVSLTTAGNAALIVSSYPAITAVLELLLYRIKPTWIRFVGILLAIAGVYLITSNGQIETHTQQLAGNLILIAAGIVWAFYNFTTRKVVAKYSMITVSFYQTALGALAFLPLAIMEKPQWQIPQTASILALLYLGLFCSVSAFLLYNYGLRKLSSGTAVTLMNLVPVLGIALSCLLLGEKVRLFQLIGGAVVILGVILSAGTFVKKSAAVSEHDLDKS